jgi:RNA polymerase sigma factor (sigma-70 family)
MTTKPYIGDIPTVLKSFGDRTQEARATPEQDAADIEELRTATGERRIQLRNQIAERYLRMIIHLVFNNGFDEYGYFSQEDFAQEACLGLIEAIETHNNKTPLSNYVARLASWRMVQALDDCAPGFRRKQKTFGRQFIDFASFDDTARAEDTETFSLSEVLAAEEGEADFDFKHLGQRLAEILSRLNEFHRVIVAELAGLIDGEPKPLSHLSQRFGCDAGTIWTHQQKALAQLRRAFPEMRQFLPGWDPEKHNFAPKEMDECVEKAAKPPKVREPKPHRVSYREIARKVGCSFPTVRRCFLEPTANIQRRAEIEKAAQELDYKPDQKPYRFSLANSAKIKITQATPASLALAAAFAS